MRMILVAVLGLSFLFSSLFVQSAEAGGSSEPPSGNGFQYVEMAPMMLPIVDDSGVSQTVSLVVALEVLDSGVADKVKALQPKLTDAFLMDMYGVLNRHAALEGGVLQLAIIKERLNKVSDKVMGDKESVHDVLLQVVQQRPI